ncbi:MAG: hypothetical protein ACJ771_12665 [Chloroflexota bacterium]
MAQTETKPGFRVPWTADRPDADPPADDAANGAAPHDPSPNQEPEKPDMIDVTTPAPARRTTKLMADLSRAMQTAAEGARDETVARFLADSKTAVEEIQATSQVEAADLRRRADDDVAVVRDWSKAEIARIREETEARIAARKQALDGEIDAHTAVVETRVQRVGATVEAFQAEMDEFFQRLLAEQDPTRIATMAETMPEPPDLAGIAASITEPDPAPFDPLQTRLPQATTDAPETVEASSDPVAPDGTEAGEAEAAMAARLDFAAAEAEALTFTGDIDVEYPSGDSDAGDAATNDSSASNGLANADAGTLSIPASAKATSRVVVVGLVSVASIATFKRGLTRSAGVSAVAVASGPDGEFIFTVEHAEDLRMADTVTALEGFGAQVTSESEGSVEVTAHDPDPSN